MKTLPKGYTIEIVAGPGGVITHGKLRNRDGRLMRDIEIGYPFTRTRKAIRQLVALARYDDRYRRCDEHR